MALNVTDSQGTKVYIVAEGVAVGTATEIGTAITGGDQIGCIQTLGEINSSRSVQEYTCMSSDESAKSSGSKTLGNVNIELLFDATDSAGQSALKTMYATNTRKQFIIELNDNGGTNPTYIIYTGFVSSETISAQKDNAVMYNVTVEIASAPAITLAS